MGFEGSWTICKMDMWNEKYFNMEAQAYILIDSRCRGEFEFGLVTASFMGKVLSIGDEEVFEFRFKGSDEMDETSGIGRLKLKDENNVEGKFEFDDGDSSGFYAKRKT